MTWIKLTAFIFISYFIFTQRCYILPFTGTLFNCAGLLTIAWIVTTHIHSLVIMKNLPRIQGDHRSVLITGCDSGFGYLTALKLNSLGFYVFATCLNGNSEGALDLPMKCSNPRRMKVLELDVTNDHDISRLVKEVERKQTIGIKFHALINNAGITSPGPIEWSSPFSVVDYMQVLDVNLLGPVRMCRAFAPLLRNRKEAPGSRCKVKVHRSTSGTGGNAGRIINVSSEAARNIAHGQVSYCVSKAALSKFNEGLAVELNQFGIHCISIEPFFYRTQCKNLAYFEKLIADKWHESSKDVQLNYGPQSLEEVLILQKYMVTSCANVSDNLNDVPNLIVEAVTSFEPDPVYSCTPLLVKCLLSIISLLPWDLYYLVNSMQNLANKILVCWLRKKEQRKIASERNERETKEEETARKRGREEGEQDIDGVNSVACKMHLQVNSSSRAEVSH